MKSTDYEKFNQDIQQFLLSAQGLETVEVKHNIKLMGKTQQKHQIDVYWEYRLAGITHCVALECKYHSRKVDLGIVRDFSAVLDDVSGLRGVIISPIGFTSGAQDFAKSKGIGLKVVRATQDTDYDGRLKTIRVYVHQRLPANLRLYMVLDEAWCIENASPQRKALLQKIQNSQEMFTKGVEIEERNTGEKFFLSHLVKYLPMLDMEDISSTKEWEKNFDEGFLVQPGEPDLKLSKIKVYYEINEQIEEVTIDANDVATILIKDALQKTLLFVNEQGRISGDLEAEGIRMY